MHKKGLGMFAFAILLIGSFAYLNAETEQSCVAEGGSLGAVIPGNTIECCEGLVAYIPENILGTRGTCIRVECNDSDGGLNYYVRGSVNKSGVIGEDCCKAGSGCAETSTMVAEAYCESPIDSFSVYFNFHACPNGCSNGACIGGPCPNSIPDGCYYLPGEYDENGCPKYACPSTACTEPICLDSYFTGQYDANKCPIFACPTKNATICPVGCECSGNTVTCPIELEETSTCQIGCTCENEVMTCEVNETAKPQAGCIMGCMTDNQKCILQGTRITLNNTGKYCSIDSELLEQKSSDGECNNNFECQSNLCIDGNCVSSGLWQKFLSWLKGLFS